jgi:hypothetical protein
VSTDTGTGVPFVVENINGLVGAAFRTANDKRARSQQQALGMSELGGCRRQAAFKTLGVEETNPRNERLDIFADSREAMIGTMIHDLVLPQIEAMSLTAKIEQPVVLKFAGLPDIPGSADMVDESTLVDLKTVGHNSARSVQANGPQKKHIWQTHGYAQALIDTGHEITDIALVYIDRSNGQVIHVHHQQFDPTVVEDIEAWWIEVNSVEDPMRLPRDERGPGLSRTCDWCPWLKACWGEGAVPGGTGVQKQVLEEFPDDERTHEIERYLMEYADANRAEREAKDRKAFAREVLSGTDEGVYGSMVLKRTRETVTDTLDVNAAKEVLVAHGLPVPMTQRVNTSRLMIKPKSPAKE